MPSMQASRNVQAKDLALKIAILGGITLAAIIGIAIFLIVHMN